MKVLQAMMLNDVKNIKLSGIISVFQDVSKTLKNLLDKGEIKNEQEPTGLIISFPTDLLLAAGRVFNVMLFFNPGSLPANVVLLKITHCIMAYEAVCSRVMGLVCDATNNI